MSEQSARTPDRAARGRPRAPRPPCGRSTRQKARDHVDPRPSALARRSSVRARTPAERGHHDRQYTSQLPPDRRGPPPTRGRRRPRSETARLKDKAADAGGHLLERGEGRGRRRHPGGAPPARRPLVAGALRGRPTRRAASRAGSPAGLTSVGGQLTQMASAPSEQNLATDIVREVGAPGRRARPAGWRATAPTRCSTRSAASRGGVPAPSSLLAAGAGVVLGRLTRGLKDAPTSPASTDDRSRRDPADRRAPSRCRSTTTRSRSVRGSPTSSRRRCPARPPRAWDER